jgi:hypothetical protein
MDAKFVADDGATMDHFSIAKTAKKAVIERISEDTFTDTNVKQVSDEKTTQVKPLADQEKVQEDKPSITFKLDEEATTDSKAKPLANQEKVQEDKPSITFKLDEEATTDSKAKPLADQEKVQEDKPAMTAKLGGDPPTDDKPISLREEKVDLSEKQKSTSFQSTDDEDKSHVQDLVQSSENSPIDDEVSDSDKVKSIDTSQKDPFASLN